MNMWKHSLQYNSSNHTITMFFYFVFQSAILIITALKFDNITYDIFPINSGIIAAFGHFNSDEFTDVFSLQQGGNKLQLFMGSETGQQFQPHVNCTFDRVITSVVPGDFNGDSIMDVLITLVTASDSTEYDVRILWGKGGSIDCKSNTLFNIVNQPLIVDFNGDMIPDIIGEVKSGEKYVWISSPEKSFTKQNFRMTQKFASPHSSGLFDINNDLAADILLMGEDNIDVWINIGYDFIHNSSFIYNNSFNYPSSIEHRLQATFIDINLDGEVDLLMPACRDSNCDKSAIFLFNKTTGKWDVLFEDFKFQNITWGFKLPKGPSLEMAALPVTLRSGDVDMDGYPDFLAILQAKSGKMKSSPVILKNNPCLNCSHCVLDRCLQIMWDIPGLQDLPNIEIAAFFDIFEDGILDILASSKDHEWKIHALKNSEILDSCFMKVLVLSGLSDNCCVDQMPYGVNQPGPIVRYNMTKQDGRPLVSSALQISQTAFFPLHLPYSVFGLGQTPNFIDALTVSVSSKFNKSVHKREWTQIIPNSQIVVIPHPPQNEKKWVKKLFVTPSHYVLLTCIALIGTCTFISIIVALLHWRERKEDKKEKMQDAYRFHFDAM